MPWCPKCKTEYLSHVKICVDCKTPLMDNLSPDKLEPEALETVYCPSNEMEALRLVDLLEQAGIIAKTISKQIPMYDNIAKLQQNYWGEILVQKDKVNESIEIIHEFLKSSEEH